MESIVSVAEVGGSSVNVTAHFSFCKCHLYIAVDELSVKGFTTSAKGNRRCRSGLIFNGEYYTINRMLKKYSPQ